MADGRHLGKNRKIAMSRPWLDRFRPHLARRRTLVLLHRPTIKNFKFEKSKMAAAAVLKNRHISTTVGPIVTKFGTLMQFDPLEHYVSKIGPQ